MISILVRNRTAGGTGRAQRIWALVDSGADICVFPRWLADALSHNWSKGRSRPVRGVGGILTPCFGHITCVELVDYSKHEFKTVAGFLEHDMPFAVLGQKGFFENFLVTMDYQAGMFSLEPRF